MTTACKNADVRAFADRDTLIRLANSCDRAAARAGTSSANQDLDAEDYRTIAAILKRLSGD